MAIKYNLMNDSSLNKCHAADPLYRQITMPRVFIQNIQNKKALPKSNKKESLSLNYDIINELIESFEKLINDYQPISNVNKNTNLTSANQEIPKKSKLNYKVSNLKGTVYTTRSAEKKKKLKIEMKENNTKRSFIRRTIKEELFPYFISI